MKLEEAKVGMYICSICNSNYIYKITKVNPKSITCTYTNFKKDELKDYVIVDKEVAKARAVKNVFTKECGELRRIIYELKELKQIVIEYKDYLLINVDKINQKIEDTLTNANKAINEVLGND